MRTFIERVILTAIFAAAVAIGFWSYPHLKSTSWVDQPGPLAIWISVWSMIAMVSVASICQIGLERFSTMLRAGQINGATVSAVFTVIGAIASAISAWVAVRG